MTQLSPSLLAVVQLVEPSIDDNGFRYRPCMLRLQDGAVYRRVYVAPRQEYVSLWGDDPLRQHLQASSVIALEPSPDRLYAPVASRIYTFGEAAMGARRFIIVDRWNGRHLCQTGDAVDFVSLPDGLQPGDIIDAEPAHPQGQPDVGAVLRGAPYAWCIYDE